MNILGESHQHSTWSKYWIQKYKIHEYFQTKGSPPPPLHSPTALHHPCQPFTKVRWVLILHRILQHIFSGGSGGTCGSGGPRTWVWWVVWPMRHVGQYFKYENLESAQFIWSSYIQVFPSNFTFDKFQTKHLPHFRFTPDTHPTTPWNTLTR